MTLPGKLPDLPGWAWAGLGFGAVWLILRPRDKQTAGEKVGQGLIDAVSTVAAAGLNVVKGAGDALTEKVFPTDRCTAAMRHGDIWGASWDCRPATFMSWIAAGRPTNASLLEDGRIYVQAPAASQSQSFADWWAGLTVKPTAPSPHGRFTGPGAGNPASVLTPSILNGGSFETQSDCLMLGVTCGVDGKPASGWDLGDWIEQQNQQNRTITPVAGTRG